MYVPRDAALQLQSSLTYGSMHVAQSAAPADMREQQTILSAIHGTAIAKDTTSSVHLAVTRERLKHTYMTMRAIPTVTSADIQERQSTYMMQTDLCVTIRVTYADIQELYLITIQRSGLRTEQTTGMNAQAAASRRT